MDKKRKTVLIAVAAMLLVVAIFLLPRRSQPLGELIPAPETARVDGLFCISTIVPTPDGYGTFDTGDCRVEGYPDSEAAAALRSAMSEISVQRYYRLPTSLLSRFTQNENYVTVWWIPEDGQKHDLYLNWDEGFIYDDANRAVAYKIDGDAQQAFSQHRVRRVHPIKFSNKKLRMRDLIRSFFASLQHFLRHLPRVVVGVQQVVRLFAKRRAEVVLVECLDIRILV